MTNFENNRINVTYCTLHNGFYVDTPISDEQEDELGDLICRKLVDFCNEDGEYIGDVDYAVAVIEDLVRLYFDLDLDVDIYFDNFSW